MRGQKSMRAGDGKQSIYLEWPKDQGFYSKFWLKNRAS